MRLPTATYEGSPAEPASTSTLVGQRTTGLGHIPLETPDLATAVPAAKQESSEKVPASP